MLQTPLQKLINHWEQTQRKSNYLPIVPMYRWPTQELVVSLVQESKTLNQLDLVEWALDALGDDYTQWVNAERLVIRKVVTTYPRSSDEVLFNGQYISKDLLVKGFVLTVAFRDGAHRIRSASPYSAKLGVALTKLGSYLAQLVKN